MTDPRAVYAETLLDVSRLTLGKIRLSVAPVDLEAVVTQAVEAVRPLVDQFRHELEVSLPPHPVRVNGDKARLTQVLTNLDADFTEDKEKITALKRTMEALKLVEDFARGEQKRLEVVAAPPKPEEKK